MPKILCIDDSSMIRTVVRLVLMKGGMEVIVASGGAEGLERMAGEKPDAVLLDMHMPDMDGLETLKRMSQDDRLSAIPVILMTADDHSETLERARQLGVREIVGKPFAHASLIECVHRVLERPLP